MSAVSERMSYEDLKDFLKSIGASDPDLYQIFDRLSSTFRCTVGFDDMTISISDIRYFGAFFNVVIL